MKVSASIVVLGLAVSLIAVGDAIAQPASSEPDTVGLAADEESWLTRTLHRYFGANPPSAAGLDGRAVEIVDRYTPFAGRTIAVVIIHQVERFSSNAGQDGAGDESTFNTLANKFQSHTRATTIREYLLFESGDGIDPFSLGDSERMLRELDFIDDVRIIVVPLTGDDHSVAVVVETRDRFPLGVNFKFVDVGRYELGAYSSNVAGLGVRFDNQVIYRDDREPNLGYRGVLGQNNIAGTFVGTALVYEDSYRRLQRALVLERNLRYPGLKWVGGAGYARTRERDAGPNPDDAEVSEVWLGRVIQLRERPANVRTARPVLVPAVSFTRKTYLDRPPVSRDSFRSFHNRQDYLVGLTFQRFKNYKTSYLFEMGETENFPSGSLVKLSTGYQDGEFHDRAMGFFQTAYYATRNRGDVLFGLFDIGGFFRNGSYEDGSLLGRAAYITPLMGQETWTSRLFISFSYALAINRVSQRVLILGDRGGIRGMDDNIVRGNQRVVGNFEYRLFVPWQVLGFRFMLMGFADVGTVTGQDDPVFESRIYTSVGLAVRVQNPNLVLPATQLRVAFLNGIDDKGIAFGFKLGGVSESVVKVPGARPGSFSFR